jgi:tRNA A37 methylthiotransferase MiaB
MRRFGDPESFLGLLGQARALAPAAGARSNFIVGFPGETEADFETLCDFLVEARLDAIGVFGYSDEDGTEAAAYDDKLDGDAIAERVAHLTALAEELTAQRAEDRIGERVEVLVESVEDVDGSRVVEGRAACQGPEVDGSTYLVDVAGVVRPGDLVAAEVVRTEGVDLVASVAPVGEHQ